MNGLVKSDIPAAIGHRVVSLTSFIETGAYRHLPAGLQHRDFPWHNPVHVRYVKTHGMWTFYHISGRPGTDGFDVGLEGTMVPSLGWATHM